MRIIDVVEVQLHPDGTRTPLQPYPSSFFINDWIEDGEPSVPLIPRSLRGDCRLWHVKIERFAGVTNGLWLMTDADFTKYFPDFRH